MDFPPHAQSVAARVSSRGGGHDKVETMALRYGDGVIEVACNLLDTDVTPPEVVEGRASVAPPRRTHRAPLVPH